MNYSNQYDNQLNNEVNYDEYNRNNQIVNNIRYNQPTYENINNNNFNTLNNNYNNNNYQNSNDINSGMNEYVRQELKSRGVNLGRGNSPRSIKFAEMEKKKTLLNNIQNQINLTKRKKIFHNSLSLIKFKLKTVIAPHNTTQFLIKNNSTPFFSEDDIELVPSSMIVIDDEKFLFDFSLQESVSTAEESVFNNKEKNYPKE